MTFRNKYHYVLHVSFSVKYNVCLTNIESIDVISFIRLLLCTLFIYICILLQGMVTLVTGGASGLGLATVQRVVREGGRAVICDLPTSKGSAVTERFGPEAIFAPTDVSPSIFVIH